MPTPPDPAWDYDDWISYFRGDLMSSVAHDVKPLVSSGGLFGVPRQFFPYVEYLSGLVLGPATQDKFSTTSQVRTFLKTWMNRVDHRYESHADLLLAMWRHGLVHAYKPKVLAGPSGRRISWASFDEGRTLVRPFRGQEAATFTHLVPFLDPTGPSDVFPVSIFALVEDLEAILGIVAGDIERERDTGHRTLGAKLKEAATFLATPVPVDFTW